MSQIKEMTAEQVQAMVMSQPDFLTATQGAVGYENKTLMEAVYIQVGEDKVTRESEKFLGYTGNYQVVEQKDGVIDCYADDSSVYVAIYRGVK